MAGRNRTVEGYEVTWFAKASGQASHRLSPKNVATITEAKAVANGWFQSLRP